MRTQPNDAELAFLQHPRGLARVATVDRDGMPHVVPTGWSYDTDTGDLLLTGRDVGATRRVRHLARHPRAAVVIDGVDDSHGWAPWALVVRGEAHYDPAVAAIRLTPWAITSWGL